VRLRGVLVYHQDQTLLDVVAGSIERLEGGTAPAATTAPPAWGEDLGVHRLAGEIVDGKCYFGVMRPGAGKVHRACAARCISSGTPPVLAVEDVAGERLHLLLVGADGGAAHRMLLPFVAEPVEVTGRVLRYENLLVMRVDPTSILRR
jgi:hypothetical protein